MARTRFVLPCLAASVAMSLMAVQAPALGVIQTLKVGGEGSWDYVALDAQAGRLYVPRSTRVAVLDLAGKVQGEIPDTAGVHGVALAKALDRGYISNGRANTMTVFRLSTLEVIREVPTTGQGPDAILFEPATRQVFTCNGKGRKVTVFDAATLEVTGTIPVVGKPEFSACDGVGRVFVNMEDTSELVAIDARTRTVVSRWPLAPLEAPTGLAMDAARGVLFSVGRNQLMDVVDAASGRIVSTLPIGAGCDGAAFDPGTGWAFAANGEGTLTVVGRNPKGDYAVLATVPTRPGARTMAVDTSTHRIYLPTAEPAPAPASAAPDPHARPAFLPGSFQIVVVGQSRP